MAILKAIFWLIALAGLAVLGLGFAGRWWPWGDSLAVARSWVGLAGLAWLALGVALGAVGWLWALVVGLAVLAALAPVGWARWQPELPGRGALVFYQKNMSFRMRSVAPLVADILASEADLVTLQEVDADNREVLAGIAGVLPGQAWCPFSAVGGTAVAARWPALETRCGRGWAAMRVDHPEGPFWLVSLHLHWPAPYGQAEHLGDILPEIQQLDGPVLLGGDFNMVPWSGAMARVEKATGARRMGRARLSLPLFSGAVQLPIDHVLAPQGWRGRSELRPQLGSDHRGVLVRLFPGG